MFISHFIQNQASHVQRPLTPPSQGIVTWGRRNALEAIDWVERNPIRALLGVSARPLFL
jgi:hypothetical protein